MLVVDRRLLDHGVEEEAVRARVSVGASQRVIWSMALGVDPVAKGTDAQWVDLGEGPELRGNHLDVTAVLMDVGDAAEELTCIVEVEGPERTMAELRRGGGHGDAAAFVVTVVFR